jgi:hypothetical protein
VPYLIPPTQADIEIANAVSDYTNPRTEQAATILTWAADEHVLLTIAAAWWLYCRNASSRRRRHSNHILVTTIAVSVLPHLLKSIFDQRRPDRLTVLGHLHGVPISGKPIMPSHPAMPCISAHWHLLQAYCRGPNAMSCGPSALGWCLPGWCCWRIGRAMSLRA